MHDYRREQNSLAGRKRHKRRLSKYWCAHARERERERECSLKLSRHHYLPVKHYLHVDWRWIARIILLLFACFLSFFLLLRLLFYFLFAFRLASFNPSTLAWFFSFLSGDCHPPLESFFERKKKKKKTPHTTNVRTFLSVISGAFRFFLFAFLELNNYRESPPWNARLLSDCMHTYLERYRACVNKRNDISLHVSLIMWLLLAAVIRTNIITSPKRRSYFDDIHWKITKISPYPLMSSSSVNQKAASIRVINERRSGRLPRLSSLSPRRTPIDNASAFAWISIDMSLDVHLHPPTRMSPNRPVNHHRAVNRPKAMSQRQTTPTANENVAWETIP